MEELRDLTDRAYRVHLSGTPPPLAALKTDTLDMEALDKRLKQAGRPQFLPCTLNRCRAIWHTYETVKARFWPCISGKGP